LTDNQERKVRKVVQRRRPADNVIETAAQSDSANSGVSLIANVLALSLVDGKPQEEQIALLGAAGYPPTKIASLLRTTSNTVRVTLSKQRSAGKKKATGKR
jgi:DNA-directed RNA polymerase specialized sigma24 family protein